MYCTMYLGIFTYRSRAAMAEERVYEDGSPSLSTDFNEIVDIANECGHYGFNAGDSEQSTCA